MGEAKRKQKVMGWLHPFMNAAITADDPTELEKLDLENKIPWEWVGFVSPGRKGVMTFPEACGRGRKLKCFTFYCRSFARQVNNIDLSKPVINNTTDKTVGLLVNKISEITLGAEIIVAAVKNGLTPEWEAREELENAFSHLYTMSTIRPGIKAKLSNTPLLLEIWKQVEASDFAEDEADLFARAISDPGKSGKRKDIDGR